MTTLDQPALTSGLATVSAIYEAFGRGDVPTILSLLSDEVVFDDDTLPSQAQLEHHPLLVCRRGKTGAAAFFAEVAQWPVSRFEVTDLVEGPGVVLARIRLDISTPEGVLISDDEIHLWRIGPDGLVTSMKHYADTAKHLSAWRGGAS